MDQMWQLVQKIELRQLLSSYKHYKAGPFLSPLSCFGITIRSSHFTVFTYRSLVSILSFHSTVFPCEPSSLSVIKRSGHPHIGHTFLQFFHINQYQQLWARHMQMLGVDNFRIQSATVSFCCLNYCHYHILP